MNFNCKNKQVVWEKINGAYVPVTTICDQTLQNEELPRIETTRTSFYRDLSIGENVIFMSNFKITFGSVTSPGHVVLVHDPENFNYFDIFTTSTFSGPVSFSSPIPDDMDFSEAKFIRILEDGSMEDITVPNPNPESGRGLSIDGAIQPSLMMLENGGDYYPVGSFGVVRSSAIEAQTLTTTIIVSGGNSGQTILNPDGTISGIDWQYAEGYEPCSSPKQLFVNIDFENGISFDCDCYTTNLSLGGALGILEAIAAAYSGYKALMATITSLASGIRALFKTVRDLLDDIFYGRQEISFLTDLANKSRAAQASIRRQKLIYAQEGINTKELDEMLNIEIQNESSLNAQIREASDEVMNKVLEKENAQAALDAAINQRKGLLEQAAAILISINALYQSLMSIPLISEKKVCPEGQTLGEDCECYDVETECRCVRGKGGFTSEITDAPPGYVVYNYALGEWGVEKCTPYSIGGECTPETIVVNGYTVVTEAVVLCGGGCPDDGGGGGGDGGDGGDGGGGDGGGGDGGGGGGGGGDGGGGDGGGGNDGNNVNALIYSSSINNSNI